MSRIHEALKKAEQERLAKGLESDAPAPEPTFSAAEEVSAPVETAGPITLEMILARSPKPHWNGSGHAGQPLGSSNHSAASEELRTLRSRLYQIRDKEPLRTVLITSALPEEGKTFLTTHLGQMIVRQHERSVLIIDGDLRRSQLYHAFGAPQRPGLVEYLRGEADEFAIIQQSPLHDGLFLIPGGQPAPNPSELLANGRLKSLIERVAPAFDWVLVDSPPVIPLSDASVIAESCDGVLLVVRAASTPYDLAQKVCDEFRDKRILGVVLNRMAPGDTYHSYYYRYYSPDAKKKTER